MAKSNNELHKLIVRFERDLKKILAESRKETQRSKAIREKIKRQEKPR